MQNLVYKTVFDIAGISFSFYMPHEIFINESFQPFLGEKETENIQIWFHEEENLNLTGKNPVTTKIPFCVYKDAQGFYRIFHDHKMLKDKPYAIGRVLSDTEEVIQFLPESREFFSESHNTFSHIAFEELLARYGAMILHASFIDTEHGGILFSGPSGVGKSTQAELWCRYKKAEQINGDRPILKQERNEWKAYGSPYAGSSRCWVNKSTSIRAIVMLEQGNECRIWKLKKAEAFRKVYENIIVNSWNDSYVEKITVLIEKLIMSVPVYHMICTKNHNSVAALEDILKGENTDGSK